MRCLMAVWSSHRGMAAGNMDESGPLAPSRSTNTAPAQWWMKQAGAYLGLIYGSRKHSPRPSAHGAVNAITWWGERKGKKDIWHWNELHACNSSSGDRKWLQFVIWTFQRWKRGRPPELSWASLLFQSCSSSSMGCWSRALADLLTRYVLCSGTERADIKGLVQWLGASI